MKKALTVRLSPRTQEALQRLKQLHPDWTQTEIIEAAIQEMATREGGATA